MRFLGGPKMVVKEAGSRYAVCQWFVGAKLCEVIFGTENLEIVFCQHNLDLKDSMVSTERQHGLD